MKKKSLLLTAVATLGLTAATMAQNVPNYVPTNGLVGWWPFNGNANDESGNGNNGANNGATLTSDRFGNANTAYALSTQIDNLTVNNAQPSFNNNAISVSLWMKFPTQYNQSSLALVKNGNPYTNGFDVAIDQNNAAYGVNNYLVVFLVGNGVAVTFISNQAELGNWSNIVSTYDGSNIKIYLNGILKATQSFNQSMNIPNNNLVFGAWDNPTQPAVKTRNIDDIGIWNRALTQLEITDLYNSVSCSNNTAITPQTNSLTIGGTASFNASTSDPNPSYVWQSDFGQGFQTLNNFGNYTGANSSTLNIANVQLANHNQPIRVISTSGNCIDTSNVAVINILDTCITNVTVYDTLLTTVTDTLIINTLITGINPPNNSNTIKAYPNPASTHITIDYGNFAILNGYQLVIENSIGQQVFQTNITQQSDYLSLSNWGGNGLYFVHIIDPQGNTIDIRKIVLQ